MNTQRKISSSRISLVREGEGETAVLEQPKSPDRDEAIERWRGEAPAQRGPSEPKPAAAEAAAPSAKKPKGRRKLAMLGAALVVLAAAGGYYGYDYWTAGRFQVATDDAYVRA